MTNSLRIPGLICISIYLSYVFTGAAGLKSILQYPGGPPAQEGENFSLNQQTDDNMLENNRVLDPVERSPDQKHNTYSAIILMNLQETNKFKDWIAKLVQSFSKGQQYFRVRNGEPSVDNWIGGVDNSRGEGKQYKGTPDSRFHPGYNSEQSEAWSNGGSLNDIRYHILPKRVNQAFNPWGGKRSAAVNDIDGSDGTEFSSWDVNHILPKRGNEAFGPWEGKRSASVADINGRDNTAFVRPFNSWSGKRSQWSN